MDRKSGLPNEAERASYQPCLDDEDLTVASSETTAFLGEATGFSLTKRATSVRYYMMFVHGLVLGANLVFFLAVWRWSNSIMCPYGPYGPELIHSKLSVYRVVINRLILFTYSTGERSDRV